MKHILFIDFESFYDSKAKYDLRHTSIVQYVRDARFKAFGAGICGEKTMPIWIPGKQLTTYFRAVGETTGWKNIAVVGHNIKFDGFILKEVYGVTPGQYIDTKGMSKGVLGKTIKGHSLANLAEHFQLPSKGIMKTDGLGGLDSLTAEQERELAEYCIHDVELCRDIYNRLANDFPANQYDVLHRTVDMFINPKMLLNVPLLEETSKVEAARRTKIFEEIPVDDSIRQIINPKILRPDGRAPWYEYKPTSTEVKAIFASNVKFPKLLEAKGFDVPMKYSPKKKNEDGSAMQIPALALGDPEFLEMLESDSDELRLLCEARVAAKSTLLETRSAKLAAIGRTGYWPFDIEFSGADQTHRFSGGKGAGGNPQNFTRGSALRTAVESPRGYELVVGDFANIELRIVAYLSRDPGLVSAIEQGTDLYCDIASVFFGRRVTKADKKERQFGKIMILGLGYGMGWKKFKRTVRLQTGQTITDEDAKKAVELYRTRYAGVPALWDALDNTIQLMAGEAQDSIRRKFTNIPVAFGHECIVLPSGLKIRFPNLRQVPSKDFKGQMKWVYDVYNKGRLEVRKLYGGKVLENISQAIAGEFCKESMMKMDDVTGLVHDEIHVRTKKGLGFVMAQKLKRVMSVPPKWMPNIKLDAEVHVGSNWGEAK